ncbi:MAG: hypothetical protein RDU59_12315 [Thermodesulfobacteriota bacterium]|nr:hypothetical protein [Thermodesulfobacteriota bacterium]
MDKVSLMGSTYVKAGNYGMQGTRPGVSPGDIGPNGQQGPQKPGDPDPIGHPNGPDSVSLSSEASSMGTPDVSYGDIGPNGQQGPQKPGDPDPIGHPNGPGSSGSSFMTTLEELFRKLFSNQ